MRAQVDLEAAVDEEDHRLEKGTRGRSMRSGPRAVGGVKLADAQVMDDVVSRFGPARVLAHLHLQEQSATVGVRRLSTAAQAAAALGAI